MDNAIKNRIDQLIRLLTQYEYEYYVLNKPSVTDKEYDDLFNELKQLEIKNPIYQKPNSPTQRVGGIISEKFVKFKHELPMLSLDNAFDESELINFDDQLTKSLIVNKNYVIEPKIDGLSISLIYENGQLQKALTRGDGEIGEDVTNNVKTIRSIPLQIPKKQKIIIRGEVYFSKKNFAKINEQTENEKAFANPRNAAAGTIRNLDSSIVARRKLSAIMYQIANYQDLNFSTHIQVLDQLEKWKFLTTKPYIYLTNGINKVVQHISEFKKIKDDWDFIIDGLVIKLNNLNDYTKIGSTSRFPKWAIAYKFPANIVETRLIDIIATVGRTGKITYIGKLIPVSIDGTIVSSATLHNYTYIEEKDIRINDIVKVYKAGEIIPKILEPVTTKRTTNLPKYLPVVVCPKCNSKLEKIPTEVDYFCINSVCPERILQNIIHYASRQAMNIVGVSDLILTKLFNAKIVTNIVDLYQLHGKKNIVLSQDFLIKEKLWNKIINSVSNSKINSFEHLLFGIGIRHVGFQIACILAKKFRSLDNLMKASFDDIKNIFGIGEKIAQSIVDFFKIDKNIELIESLKNNGVNTSYLDTSNQVDYDSPYFQKIFVITGTFTIPREEIKSKIKALYNAEVKATLSNKTNFLLAGNNATQKKVDQAKSMNIEIITKEIW